METVICGTSAFKFYRIPPCVLALVEDVSDLSTTAGRRELLHRGAFLDYLNLPLRLLTQDRSERYSNDSIAYRLWTGELPAGSTIEVGTYLSVTSPLFTLLTMAPSVSELHLAMAMYEYCGTFSCIRLLPAHRQQIQDAINKRLFYDAGGWRPVLDSQGKLTDLWKRDPLVEIEELKRFAASMTGVRYHKKFQKAVDEVCGIAASPFEVEAAMAFSRVRRRGGEGFGVPSLNHVVRLSPAARSIASQDVCYCDLFYEGNERHPPLAIECHSRLIHDEPGHYLSDADRALALKGMGITVLFLTRGQLVSPRKYQRMTEVVARELGIERRPKTVGLQEREHEFHRELFIDWTTLGD